MIYEDVKMDKKKEKKNIKDFIPAVLVSLAASFMLMVFAPIETVSYTHLTLPTKA